MKRKMLKSNSMSNSSSSHGNDHEVYLYDLPISVRDSLCATLDEKNVWRDLAETMMLLPSDIQNIRNQESKGNSPMKEIIKIWGGQYNHTVTELYYVLYNFKLYQGMKILKDYVAREHHYLLISSLPKFSTLLQNETKDVDVVSKKLLNCSLTSSSGVSNSNNLDESSANANNVQNPPNSEHSISLDEEHIHKYASSILEINYNELCEATNNWSDANVLGKGGFGTVYKGYWKHTDVAIKLMHYKKPNGTENIKVQIQQSLNELKFLNSCRHDNILPLYGYSVKGDKPCLVYQLMLGGSLEDRLFGKKTEPLSSKKMISICLGTARGINFLHTFRDKPLIHGDIKPANILLDYCLTPKIGDFGLAREGPNAINTAVEVTKVFGTKFYLPPELINYNKLSTKVDTFSYGIVILEAFTGLRAYNKQRSTPLSTYVKKLVETSGMQVESLINPRISMEMGDYEMCKRMLEMGLICTSDNPDERPEMAHVLQAIGNLCQHFNIFVL